MTAKPNPPLEFTASPAGAFRRQFQLAEAEAKRAAAKAADQPTPEAIHDARVALRRQRAVIDGFGALFDKPQRRDLAAGWKALAKALGPARSLDVAAELLRHRRGAADDPAALATALQRLDQVRAEARATAAAILQRALDEGRFDQAPPSIPPNAQADQPLDRFIAKALDRQLRRFRKASRRLAKLPPARRHKARVKAKTWRYVVELFAQTRPQDHGRRRQKLLDDLQTLQDELGALNDRAGLPDLLASALAGAPAAAALAVGEVVAEAEATDPERLKKALRARRRILRRGPYWRAGG